MHDRGSNGRPPLLPPAAPDCHSGLNRDGAVQIGYKHPESGLPVVGYFATSGRTKSAEDLYIVVEAAKAAGCTEVWKEGGPSVFEMPA